MAFGVVVIPPHMPFPNGARCPCLYLRKIPIRYAGLFRIVTLVSETAEWYSLRAAKACRSSIKRDATWLRFAVTSRDFATG